MEMSRRRFCTLLTGAWLIGAAGFRRVANGILDTRLVRAVRGKVFPGAIRPLDEAETKRRSRWAG